MAESNGCKRVTCKRRYPNKFLQDLLESLYQDAINKRRSIAPSLREAISSLEKYPLFLTSGAECAILKGFDQRLCRYIDLKLDDERNKNKKIKVWDNTFPERAIRHSLPDRQLLVDISDSEMTPSAKNHEKDYQLATHSKKPSFVSKFGESSHNSNENDAPCDNFTRSKVKAVEQIQNSSQKNGIMARKFQNSNNLRENFNVDNLIPDGLTTYFTDIISSCNSQDDEGINFDVRENWESYTNDQQQSTNKPEAKIRKLCQLTEVLDRSKDDSIPQINLVSVEENHHVKNQCNHKEEMERECKQCECISLVGDWFEFNFKQKSKQDAEEIDRCVVPRKMYRPVYRSFTYAILVALLEQRNECPYRDCLTKHELMQKAQVHSDELFTSPKAASNYTAWTKTKKLVDNGLVKVTSMKHKNEEYYMLTSLGRLVAMELVREDYRRETLNDVIFHGQRNDRVPSLEDVVLVSPPSIASVDEEHSPVFIEMPPGTFEIVMLIDKREHIDPSVLGSPKSKYEARSLTIGDFQWVARSKKTGQELVLPYVVERKRMDDLASSIKDGRYQEQKFRLRKCGLKHVIYLIENCRNGQYSLPSATLMQAVVNTNILEEFNIVKTDSLKHTFRFLGTLSEALVHKYMPLSIRGCNRDTHGKELMTFEFCYKFSCKNKPLTVRDTFRKMLLQLKGLSIEKVLAITDKYSTPRLLMKAYEKCTVKEGELLLANLKFNNCTQNVGPTVSKTIYKLFSKGT